MRKKGALGGGTFTEFNKEFPGTYTNMISVPRAMAIGGERGTVTAGVELDWGEDGLITLDSSELQTESMELIGYSFTDEKLAKIRDLAMHSRVIKLYRLNKGGEKAKATIGDLSVAAKYSGVRGNDIKVVIQKDVDDENTFEVLTFVDDILKDTQFVEDGESLKANDYVEFKGKTLEETAGTNLEGGTNGEVTGESYADYLDDIESENFDVITYDGDDEATKLLISSFVKRMNDEEGFKVTGVLHDYDKPNFNGVISIFNKAVEDSHNATFWYAGKTAGADYNESLTNALYDGEAVIDTKLKKREISKAANSGNVVFYADGDDVRVFRDINTFTEFTQTQNKDYSDNRIIRTLNHIAITTAITFNTIYLGKADNDSINRTIFKNNVSEERYRMQNKGAIENFSIDDIDIYKGPEKGDVIINETVDVTGAMETLYQTVRTV